MIDRDVFADEFGLLDKHFPGERSVEETRRYYEVLSERMDTREFTSACERLFIEREHFPRPKDFLEAAGESSETRALKSWETVERVVRGFSSREELTDEAERTVKLMGGMRQLRMTRDENWPHRRREFLKLYGDAERIEEQESRQELEPGDTSAEELLEEATGAVSLPGGET